MADLEQMRTFAVEHNFNLTGMLEHDAHVVPLAERWLPLIRFHEDERFHPIGLDGLALIPREVFNQVEPAAQADLELDVTVSDVGGTTVTRSFAPPVLLVENPQGDGRLVLNDGDDTLSPFARAEVGERAVLTHGPGFRQSNSIFGAGLTIDGLEEPSPGNPREPRHPIKVTAEFRMVKETLHYFLRVNAADPGDYPKSDDSLCDAMDRVEVFFEEMQQGQHPGDPFSSEQMAAILLRLLDAEANPSLQDEAVADIPTGWALRNDVFETARNCAILEYHLVYAYNDYDRYEPWPANYHEGDDEGFCYVFDRRQLERAIRGEDLNALLDVLPLFVMTSVHEERQQADRIKEFDVISQNEVFVARGSHATYLDPGSHDFLSFEEAFEEGIGATPHWLTILSLGTIPLLIGLVAALGEHLMDSNDETSEGGIAAGSEGEVPPELADEPRFFGVTPETTPLSLERHIYQADAPPSRAEDRQLGLLSYAGKLGAHDGGLGS